MASDITARTDAPAGERVELLTITGPEADRLRKVASAIRDGRPGSSVRLTRLVDGVSTWTAIVPGLPPHEFDDREDATEWASDVASLIQARAVAAALAPDPSAAGVAVPVAWRYRDHDWTAWLYSETKPRLSADWRFIEPVYAAPMPRPAPEEGDLVSYLHRQWAWSKETFGPALRTKGIVQHITKELREIEADPHDLAEWVDVIILAMDGFWRHGGKPEDLLSAMQAKQDKNFARTWPDWRTMGEDQAIEHDRSGEAKAAAPAQGAGVDLAGVEAALDGPRELPIMDGWCFVEASRSREGVSTFSIHTPHGTGCDEYSEAEALALHAAISRRTAGPESGDGVGAELRRLSEAATPGRLAAQGFDEENPADGVGLIAERLDISPGGTPTNGLVAVTTLLPTEIDAVDSSRAEANADFMVAAWNFARARISAEDRTSLADGATGGEEE